MAMTFKKPTGVKYVQMCIDVDRLESKWSPENPFTKEEEELIYQYVYHLYYNFACRERYFNKMEEYDEYALFCAAKAWSRLTDASKPRLKSILNYIKKTKYGWKRKFQRETYQQILSNKYTKGFDYITFKEQYKSSIRQRHREKLENSVYDDLRNIPIILRNIVEESPYGNDPEISDKLYISALISYIKEIKEAINCKNIEKYSYKYINNPTLWRLDSSYKNTVNLIISKLKTIMTGNIKYSISRYGLSEKEVDNILVGNTSTEIFTGGESDE